MVWLIFPNICFLAVSDKPAPGHSGIQPEQNGPSADAGSGSAEEEGSCEQGAQQDTCSQSPEPSASTLLASKEPQSQLESFRLVAPEEASTRSSALQETDDSDDDPVLIPGARYRGGPGHRWGHTYLCLAKCFLPFFFLFSFLVYFFELKIKKLISLKLFFELDGWV